ncbi:50S ribosomal protein L23 [Patescibacteria group bacterium]|nr:50S ribosomal protein L23 [Patescibacteria group bacterium]
MAFFKRTKKSEDKPSQPKADKVTKVKSTTVTEAPAEPNVSRTKSDKKTVKHTEIKRSTLVSKELDLSGILLRPRITEKATIVAESGVYVFEVSKRATKHTIKQAVKKIYKVDAVRVNIVKIPSKKRVSGRTRIVGVKSSGKKAYVYLKKGDRIEFV